MRETNKVSALPEERIDHADLNSRPVDSLTVAPITPVYQHIFLILATVPDSSCFRIAPGLQDS